MDYTSLFNHFDFNILIVALVLCVFMLAFVTSFLQASLCTLAIVYVSMRMFKVAEKILKRDD